ncbi:hypothetical protein [Cryobacterium zhongshanensis]|uniref:Uncharacterized protein n=1 Tax=Cryobacterium zhongshanensis TaxID=2928153 RepID=A0AA41UES9_9MICO|nr:hypothetical protein [Cryobacterium zhongshanensis]MCI4657320.1 hypothetical protein [Cryobacterium zhongshanensis]
MKSTSPGARSSIPTGPYEATQRIRETLGVLELDFVGNDNRQKTYRATSWPLSELHRPFIEGIAAATGYKGTCRTERSATNLWTYTRRFLNYLDGIPDPPRQIRDISGDHIRGFYDYATDTSAEDSRTPEQSLSVLRIVIVNIPTVYHVHQGVHSFLARKNPKKKKLGVSGMSDEVFTQVIRAARADVVNIRTRIGAGRALAQLAAATPASVPPPLRRLGDQLVELLDTGALRPGEGESARESHQLDIAANVFLINADLTPLMILLAAVSGRNSETIKELPAEHETADDRAVRLQIIKRRSGGDNWFEDVHWEVGNPSRQLHTSGGIYMLIHDLCAPSRRWAESDRVWAVWTNPRGKEPIPNRYPWARSLQGPTLDLGGWAKRHAINEHGKPLDLSFNRIRTTYLRRETRAVGGHAPSAATKNTQDVLFANYLAGDETTKGWADDIITETFFELEEQVRSGRSAALANGSGRLGDLTLTDKSDESAYLGCRDIEHGPHTPGAPCGASALACFSCPNALIGEKHLPKLLNLRAELETRWERTTPSDWWTRYGVAWIALNDDIFPRYSKVELAELSPDTTMPLDLLEDSW